MNHHFSAHVIEQFSPDDIVDLNAYVDDCRCACRSAFTVKEGLLNVHGRPIFDRLLIDGDLMLSGDQDIQRLPDLLAVTGTIDVSDCLNLKIMPSKMYVGGSVRMSRTSVRELPGTFIAEREVQMNECPNVLAIPDGLRTGSLEAAACAKLTSIAAGLEFTSLDLSGTPVVELPSKLTVNNELKLRNCFNLAIIQEGAIVRSAIDVRGCDMLFTLPQSVQPSVTFTDGMFVSNDWVIVPNMTGEQAAMCLGRKGIDAFPHRHFKNLDRMQDIVTSIDREGKGRFRNYAVGALNSDRPRRVHDEFLRRMLLRLNDRETTVLSGPVQIKRLR